MTITFMNGAYKICRKLRAQCIGRNKTTSQSRHILLRLHAWGMLAHASRCEVVLLQAGWKCSFNILLMIRNLRTSKTIYACLQHAELA
jgi:hypothetical protein